MRGDRRAATIDMPSSSEIQEVGRRLRKLSDSPPSDGSSLEQWTRDAQEIQRHLASDPRLSAAIPHFVWRYLSDADIRLRDFEYRISQQSTMEEILVSLEAGVIPPDDS